MFEVYTVLLVHVGDVGAASDALEDYLETIEGKSARYIQYCNMQCYLYWMTENFDIAVKWGQEGEDLRISSNVDTVFTSAHNLALAQRDSGAVDKALVYFLMGVSMDEVLDPKLLDADRGGAFYGNIGRCLHLMGQVDSAITCYKKSAKLLQTRLYDSNVENQAYIRQWFGELLKRRGDVENSIIFMEAAFAKWKVVSIPKAEKVKRDLYAEYPEWVMPLDFAASERRAVAWIMA